MVEECSEQEKAHVCHIWPEVFNQQLVVGLQIAVNDLSWQASRGQQTDSNCTMRCSRDSGVVAGGG